jgi:polyphenol oxidase
MNPGPADWLHPAPLPQGVGALMSTRAGGLSQPPWASCNLGDAVGDDPQAVAANRQRLAVASGARWVFLRQVHGVRVVDVEDVVDAATPVQADAAVSTTAGLACVVQVADCLPVLMAAPGGRAVGAAHAGWRGLAGGVLEATLARVCARAGCTPAKLWCWLGPCIGPRRFEVGADVLRAFGAEDSTASGARFVAKAPGADGLPRWWADLAGLARDRLQAAGVAQWHGGNWCTVEDAERFYSFRRDGVTGRMAAAIWISRG